MVDCNQREKVQALRGRILIGEGLSMRGLALREGWSVHSLWAVTHRYWGLGRRPRSGTEFERILLRLEEITGNPGSPKRGFF